MTNLNVASLSDVVSVSVAAYSDHVDAYTAYNQDAVGPAVLRFANSLEPGSRILDAGCGPGRDLARFAALGHHPVGVDLNADFVAAAKKHGPAQVADLRDLPFAADTFDGIWACASLVHLPEREAIIALRELVRVAKPGSPVTVSVKVAGQTGWVETAHGRRWFQIWTPERFACAAALAGMDVWSVDTGNVFVDVWGTA